MIIFIQVKEKIFYYLSNPKKDLFFLPNNLQLWYKTKNNNFCIIGYHYKGIENIPIINVKKIKKDNDLIKFKKIHDKSKITLENDNNILLNEATNNINNNFFINIALLNDEIIFLKAQKVKIDENLINGYLFKYFPFGIIIDKETIIKINDKYNIIKNKNK